MLFRIGKLAVLVVLAALSTAGALYAQGNPIDGFDSPGAYTLGFVVGGLERSINVYVPEGYDPDELMPLVLVLHGAGGTGAGVASFTGFNALADEEGFVVVYPDGYRRAWNDQRPDAELLQVNDVGFINAVIDFLDENLAIDPDRIYATGYSMGGMMSFRLGCQLQDRIAAAASVASTFPAYQLDACVFTNPVPVLVIHGTGDEVVPIQGYRDQFNNRLMLSADETLRYWADHNNCTDAVETVSLPDTDPDDQTRVRVQSHDECENDADVAVYIVRGGGHTWPGRPFEASFDLGRTSMDMDATRVVWEFFKAHPRSAD